MSRFFRHIIESHGIIITRKVSTLSQYDDWIREDEYPDEADIDAFGDDSPPDGHPLTIGYVGDYNRNYWSGRQIFMLIMGLILIGILVLPFILQLLSR